MSQRSLTFRKARNIRPSPQHGQRPRSPRRRSVIKECKGCVSDMTKSPDHLCQVYGCNARQCRRTSLDCQSPCMDWSPTLTDLATVARLYTERGGGLPMRVSGDVDVTSMNECGP